MVEKVRLDGTFDIAYDDGEEEIEVPEDMIRFVATLRKQHSSVSAGSTKSATAASASKVAAYKQGDMVLGKYCRMLSNFNRSSVVRLYVFSGNFQGRGVYLPGTVSYADSESNTFTIYYDNGESEEDVHASLIKPAAASTGDGGGGNNGLVEGVRVESNYKGKGKYYPAVIKMDRGDGASKQPGHI